MDLVEINPGISEPDRSKYRGEEIYGEMGPTLGVGVDLIDSIFKQYLTL